MRERVTVRTDDGWQLRGEVLSEGSRGVVVLAHAMMASRRTMDRPAGAGLGSALGRAGFAVLSFDLRGHGESGPSAREGGRYSYDDFVLYDMPALVAFARAHRPGLPLAVVGHSLGGHTAMAAAGVFPERAPDAIVSIAGNMWVPQTEPSALRRAAKGAVLRGWLGITEAWGHFDPRPLKMGTEAVALPYLRQFVQMWRERRYGSADGSIDYLAALGRVTIPVLSVASEGDALLAHPEAVSRFVGHVRGADMRVVRRGELFREAPSHMGLLTDARSAPVWEEIGRWLLERLPARAG
jgi:predicted alpha/beta hydrolase